MLEIFVCHHPIASMVAVWLALVGVVWLMPGEPRPEALLSKAMLAIIGALPMMRPLAFFVLALLLVGVVSANGWRILEERETQYACEAR